MNIKFDLYKKTGFIIYGIFLSFVYAVRRLFKIETADFELNEFLNKN